MVPEMSVVRGFARARLLGTASLLAVAVLLGLGAPARADETTTGEHDISLAELQSAYDIGSPRMTTIWVDPRRGRDSQTGTSRGRALRTLAEAWTRIPKGRTLATGVRIRILPGSLGPAGVPNYLESRYGTAQAPIIIESAGRAATLASLNIFDVRHLALLNLRITATGGDALHCEQCDHLLLRGNVIRGAPRDSGRVGDLLKVNQSSHVFLEGNDISGASDNAVDFVAVQYGVLRGNRIHDAEDWCAYAKGGSAYIRVDANEIYDCGTGGFTAGQGTGLQFMVPPWLQYEAYDVRVVNNLVHDTEGAGLGVNGGFNVLLAFNTMYRVGSRSHLLEFVPGGRSCDGEPGDEGRDRCARYLAMGGWGTTRVGDGENYVRIPNRHVYVFDNLIVNPPGAASRWQHLEVPSAYDGPGQADSGVASPTSFDEDLRIVGNVIWDGSAGHPTGIGEQSGCQPSNPTCNEVLFRSQNLVNLRRPVLAAPESGNYRLATPAAFRDAVRAIPDFTWADAPMGIPAGRTSNVVAFDREGRPRTATSPPGAYSG